MALEKNVLVAIHNIYLFSRIRINLVLIHLFLCILEILLCDDLC